jgi:ABC-type uncharacterized transport system involved in gliding motility auxiliary subunit
MRVSLMFTMPFAILLTPLAALHAQTEGVQKQVEVKLWFWRVFQRIEDAAGVPPIVTLFVLPVLFLASAVAAWLWYSRKKRAGR